jgi:prevent-host-death family protein
MATWQLQTAKAKLSELLRAVRDDGPQTISVHGKEEFVVSVKGERANDQAPKASGLDLFRPVLGIGVDIALPERGVAEPRLLWWEGEFDDPKPRKRRRTKR